METPGTDEPSQTADPDAPEPSGAPVTEPVVVGDPVGGATATASITPPGAPTPPPVGPASAAPTPPPLTRPTPPRTPPPAGPPTGGPGGPAGPSGPGSPGSPDGPGGSDDGGMFAGGLSGDWPAQATDAIVNVVGAVRDRTTGPITTIARGVVFGFFAAVLGIAVAVMLIIAAIRLLDEVLPSGVWLAYLVLGVVVLIAGALVFRKRNQPTPAAGNTGRP